MIFNFFFLIFFPLCPTQIHPEPFCQRGRTFAVLLDGKRIFQLLVVFDYIGYCTWMNAEKCNHIWQFGFGKWKDCHSIEWHYYLRIISFISLHFLFPLQVSWYNIEQCSTRLVCSWVSFSGSGRRHSLLVWYWSTGVPGSKLECSNSWNYCYSLLYVHRIWWNCSSINKTEDKIS